MGFSDWICTNSTKNMFVKIVHPGGHVELHERPVLAAEIICRNPRCVVAHPHVFQQPWAIVAPETPLMPGQKFYLVPISTIRKLQRLSNKYSPSPVRQTPTSQSQKSEELSEADNRDSSSICWFFRQKNALKNPYSSMSRLDDDDEGTNKTKAEGDDSGEETRWSSNLVFTENRGSRNRKRTRGYAKGSPKRHAAADQWQPSLESINETEE